MVEELFEEELLIPKERVAVLIGPKGKTKKQIEKIGNVKLQIDAKEGLVRMQAKDALTLWLGRQVVEAIGRGFNPEIAQKIFKEENSFELINLQDYGGKSKKSLERLRGRLIGTKGKTKRVIRHYTGADISVHGKTVGIIGPAEGVQVAHRAIEMLLSGARHGTVYHFLETQTKQKFRGAQRNS